MISNPRKHIVFGGFILRKFFYIAVHFTGSNRTKKNLIHTVETHCRLAHYLYLYLKQYFLLKHFNYEKANI